jgi:hypothetical protein
MGNPPVVTGLTATFPKLKKRLIDQNPEIDPDGDYADGDPTDPNYGKETGGIYTVQVTLSGTSVSGSDDLVVLPSGTAKITLGVLRFATELHTALDEAGQALAGRNFSAIAAANSHLATISHNLDYSPKLLAGNNALAPANGSPVTHDQVAARFAPAPDDATFGTSLDAITLQVRLIRSRIESISAATLSQGDLDTLRAAVATYKSMNAAISALKPTPLGVTAAGDQIDTLLTSDLVLLFDSVTRKSSELLSALPVNGMTQKKTSTRNPRAIKPMDFANFWDNFGLLFSIFTDLDGLAYENIRALAASLANDLINIAAANIINALDVGTINVDFISAGGQFSFACPRWLNTYIEGEGFSPKLEKNNVSLIGCMNSELLMNLVNLREEIKDAHEAFRHHRDVAPGIRLGFKIRSIVHQLEEGSEDDFSFAADAAPNSLQDGLLEGTDLVFACGWPRVNQAELPCVGIVVVFNFETGAFRAVNVNFLHDCGGGSGCEE